MEKNIKQTIALKEKIFEFVVYLFFITLGVLFIIKFGDSILTLGVKGMMKFCEFGDSLLALIFKDIIKLLEFLGNLFSFF